MKWARSHVYMSPDLVHDQPFAEYVTTKVRIRRPDTEACSHLERRV